MKQKNIDLMRETRLWLRDIVIPASIAVIYMKSDPRVEQYINDKWEHFANKFRKNPQIKIYK